jgi:hypothetical protein
MLWVLRTLISWMALLPQLARASTPANQIGERELNFIVSLVKGIKPGDQIEAMLAAQMTAVHIATMRFAARLARVENLPQQDSAERAFNKLARTFAAQMEALKRYRTGGEQKRRDRARREAIKTRSSMVYLRKKQLKSGGRFAH